MSSAFIKTVLHLGLILCLMFVFVPFTIAQEEEKLPADALKVLYEAQLFMQEDQFDAAIARLNEYLATQPPGVPAARVYMMLGNCWYAKEDFEETRKAFGKAYEIDPTDTVVLRNYTAMTYHTERFVDAAVLWEKLYEMEDPRKPRTLWQAAGAYYIGEDLENSERVLERLLRLPRIPPDPQWYQLIIEVSNALGQTADVERYVQEFLRLNPVQAYYWTLLSQIQLDKNDLSSGARSLEMAYSIQPPNNKNQWRNLAEIYLYVGETEKAAHYYEKAGVTKEEAARYLSEGKRLSISREETFDTTGFGEGGLGDGIAVEFDAAGLGLNMDEFGFDLSRVDKAPRVIQRVLPMYPFSAKSQGIRARVKIRCLVDKDGNPQNIVAAECDPEDALDIFGPPAVEAVKKWRFSPGEIGGDPVQTRVAFWIIFELPKNTDETNQ